MRFAPLGLTNIVTSLLLTAVVASPASQARPAPAISLPRHEGKLLSLTLAVDRLIKCPVQDSAGQVTLFGQRLDAALSHLLTLIDSEDVLAQDLGANKLQFAVLSDARTARDFARSTCGVCLNSFGVVSDSKGAGVLHPTRNQRRDEQLWRASAHAIVHLALNRAIAPRAQQQLGYGWLTTGLAHHCEATAGTGILNTFVVREVVQQPLLAFSGDWRTAVGTLLQRQQLPRLADLLATESSAFDPAQHVLSLALVDWLDDRSAPLTHDDGNAAMRRLAQLVKAARDGEPATKALTRIVGQDIATIEQRLHEFVRKRAGKQRPRRPAPVVHHKTHPHAAVYVYTCEPIRPRHRKIVQKALAQRHAAHTSGWRRVEKKPLLAVGPVNRAAGFWHGNVLVKNIPRTWPMVAVFEYVGVDKPTAYLDCFRRVTGRAGDGGWMLDPGVGFVAHHNAQFVTDKDDRYHYLAVPDTPTGSHVSGSEFVHRGRVTWQGGRQACVGVLTVLAAPKTKTVATWHATHRQLVDWLVQDRSKKAGITEVGSITDLERDLAAWGTRRVFHLPRIPPGLTAGR